MILDKALEELLRGELSKKGGSKSYLRGAFINLDSKPVLTEDDLPPINMHTIYVRSLEVNIKYTPRTAGQFLQEPYCIMSYMLDEGRERVNSWEDCIAKSKQDTRNGLVLKWLLENSNLDEEIFEIAAVNQEMTVPIAIDIKAYGKKLYGEDYKNKPILLTPLHDLIQKEYQKMCREEFLKSENERNKIRYRKRKEIEKCRQQ